MANQQELYTLADATIKAETAAAILVETDAGGPIWIPLSQIHRIKRRAKGGAEADVTMTVWIAKAKGLI